MSENKSVLIVSPVATHPLNAGNSQRVHDMAVALRRLGYSPFLLYCQAHAFGDEYDLPGLQAFWGNRFKIIRKDTLPDGFKLSWRLRTLYRLYNLRSKIPVLRNSPLVSRLLWEILLNEDASCPLGLEDWIARFCQEEAPAACVFIYFVFSRAAGGVPAEVPVLLDTLDVFTSRNKRMRQEGEKTFFWHSLSRRQEKRALSRADWVLSIQNKETEFLSALLGAGPTKVVTVDLLAPAGEGLADPATPTLAFLGSGNPLNLTGLNWFLETCWPRIRAAIPEVRLLIAGSVCGKLDAPAPGVECLGYVNDIRDFFGQASCFINPILSGTGLKIKAVEALRNGLPVVSTKLGAVGLEAAAPDALCVVGNEDQMVRECVALLRDPSRRAKMRSAALGFYRDHHEQAMQTLREAVEPACSEN